MVRLNPAMHSVLAPYVKEALFSVNRPDVPFIQVRVRPVIVTNCLSYSPQVRIATKKKVQRISFTTMAYTCNFKLFVGVKNHRSAKRSVQVESS